MTVLISVVVCTRNRADVLAGALLSLTEQTAAPAGFEVIVVDNNSTDRTREVVDGFSTRVPNLRYCLETEQGLSNARNRGWREARGEYLAYTDDDAKAPPEWLEIAGEVIAERAPAAFGGPNYPFYNSPKPRWYRDEYGTHELGPQARELGEGEFLYGMNVFFRRSVIETLGGFDPTLGMTGTRIAYGEETAVQVRIRTEMPGEVVHYEPRLYVYHLVPARKMTWRWVFQASWASGRDSYRVFGPERSWPKRLSGIVRWLQQAGILGVMVLRGLVARDRQRFPYFQNYLYDRLRRHVRELGALSERIRL